jgi:two-component system, LuxR family, sensor kinase FixL
LPYQGARVIQSSSAEVPAISEAHLRLLFQNLGEAVFMLDPAGHVEGWTLAAQRVFGYAREQIAGLSASTLYEGNVDFGAFMHTAIETGRAEQDSWHLRRDGSRFWAHEVMCSIRAADGGNVGFAVIVRDLSELMRKDLDLLEKSRALQQSNRELEEFAAIASHDLQEPLRKILAFSDRLQTQSAAALDDKGADYLRRIVGSCLRMRQLVDDLLSYSRFAKAGAAPVKVDLGRVCKQVLVDLGDQIERSKAKVTVGDLPCVMAEPAHMRQLLQNLISNALKFVAPGQTPQVEVESRDMGLDPMGKQVWELSVQDHGVGFDEKYLDRIFRMLERLHTREQFEGTGMGLAICRRIAERSGGGITARSRPGEGARFIVTLKTGALDSGEAA